MNWYCFLIYLAYFPTNLKRIFDVKCPSVCCAYALLPLANKEAEMSSYKLCQCMECTPT